jgi:hypothetical protein
MQALVNAAVAPPGLLICERTMVTASRAGTRERDCCSCTGCSSTRREALVPVPEVAAMQLAAAARQCLVCRDKATCIGFLDGDANAHVEEFCPNADLIARCKGGQQSSPLNAG